jgi:hypothetical protein
VIDVRGATIALPEGASFFPPLAVTTQTPSRGMGLDVGAHVYVRHLGQARIGVGASLLQVRGKEIPPATTPTSSGPSGMQVSQRSLAPQVSLNFGTADGWSYVSAGAGVSQLSVKTVGGVEAQRNITGVVTINVGGGARWFMRDRLGFGFDVRLYRLAAAGPMLASTQFSVAAGVSMR